MTATATMGTIVSGLAGIALGCLLITILFALKERKERKRWHAELEQWTRECNARMEAFILRNQR